ncbi:hypothetical protein PM082_003877 [Marasmius tenuissimus]|nr:hypothetical protein PM082_003877 [Marasmius tenuissimus]
MDPYHMSGETRKEVREHRAHFIEPNTLIDGQITTFVANQVRRCFPAASSLKRPPQPILTYLTTTNGIVAWSVDPKTFAHCQQPCVCGNECSKKNRPFQVFSNQQKKPNDQVSLESQSV